MFALVHKILYRALPLEGYLRVVSRLFFLCHRLGIGRRSAALEYVYHLPQLVGKGSVCIDIGANLGYYARTLARLTGPSGRVYAVEPVPVIGRVLRRNLRGYAHAEILPYALGGENRPVRMANDTVRTSGYFGTGQNYVDEGGGGSTGGTGDCETFEAEMRRGSELFASLRRLDFIKCDIEGYELHVLREMRPLVERFRPTVLVETGGGNRPQVIALFRGLGYEGFTLERGREVPLAPESPKDIIFRPRGGERRSEGTGRRETGEQGDK